MSTQGPACTPISASFPRLSWSGRGCWSLPGLVADTHLVGGPDVVRSRLWSALNSSPTCGQRLRLWWPQKSACPAWGRKVCRRPRAWKDPGWQQDRGHCPSDRTAGVAWSPAAL